MALMIIGSVVVVGAAVWMVLLYAGSARAKALDSLFLPLVLTGRQYLVSGRQYEGTVGDRQVNVYIRSSRRHGYGVIGTENVKRVRYTGDTVEMFVQASVRTRLDLVNPGGFGRDAPHETSRKVEKAAADRAVRAIRARSAHQDVPHSVASLAAYTIRGLDPDWGSDWWPIPRSSAP